MKLLKIYYHKQKRVTRSLNIFKAHNLIMRLYAGVTQSVVHLIRNAIKSYEKVLTSPVIISICRLSSLLKIEFC